jgi:AcrR family transcriptional regulator
MERKGPATSRRTRADASDRILRATVRCVVDAGAASLSMHQVAEEAGVSKGLIHYHFHDKETLLARSVEWIARALATREADALAAADERSAVDDLWTWLEGELKRGHIRVLLELGEWRGPLVRAAAREAAAARRERAAFTAARLFGLLGLRSRVPESLLADVVVSFMDGLAAAHALHPDGNHRPAFDVFWLALLGLAD